MARRPVSAENAGIKPVDQPILERVHDRFTYAVDRTKEIRLQAKIDMRHVKGDPWDPKERLAREKAKRPVIALDELGQYENQVVNEVRANPRAIKFSPTGDGANDKTAQFYANKTREIEYRSHAQQHYTRAFQNMVERSYGFGKVRTEFATNRPAKPGDPWSAFNKRLVIDGVADPDTIYYDPDFVDATGRDWKFLFEIETRSTREFKLEWPKAELTSFNPELVAYSRGWLTNDTVRIASYWELERNPKTMFAYEVVDPRTGQPVIFEFWEDEEEQLEMAKAAGGVLKAEREADNPTVTQYITNGVEILRKTPWPGKWIPYVAFFGKMLWLDEGNGPELMIMSMTRLARDPNMLHAYYTSCEAELIGATPKVPWWVWKGSLDPKNATRVQKSNHEPVAFIEVDTQMVNGGNNQPTPSLPQRMPFEPPIQAIEMGKEGARRSIQAAMGLTPLPTSAQRRNDKSGVALKQIEDSGQRGSYHFMDSYNMGIERFGELLEDLIPKVHDTAGPTPVLGPDMKPADVYLQMEQAPEGDSKAEALASIEGSHAVTIEVGPEVQSERQEASNFVDVFVGSPMFQMLPPPMAMKILSLLIKLKNLGPIGDQISETISPTQEDPSMIPKQQAQEIIQQAQKVIDMLQQRLSEVEGEQKAKVVETQGKLAVTTKQNEAKMAAEQLKAETTLEKTEMETERALALQKMEERLKLLELSLAAQTKGAELEHSAALEGQRGKRDDANKSADRDLKGQSAEADRRLKGQTAVLAAKSKQDAKPKGRGSK